MQSYCVVCKAEIDEKRVWRGSHFCSTECHQAYRKDRRALKASKVCRWCGHKLPRPKKNGTQAEPQRSAPEVTQELLPVCQ